MRTLGSSGIVKTVGDFAETEFTDMYCVKEGNQYRFGFIAKSKDDFSGFLYRHEVEAAILAKDGEVRFYVRNVAGYDCEAKIVEYNVNILGGIKNGKNAE